MRIKSIFFLSAILFSAVSHAQTQTNSPYTRFGVGELNTQGAGINSGLGGAAAGIRSNFYLNYQNPASYSAIDSLSFLFEIGFSGKYSSFQEGDLKNIGRDVRMNQIAMGFPITRWWSAGVGIYPYSTIGYNLRDVEYDPEIGTIDYFSEGTGGLNKVFFGQSFKIHPSLSLGLNFSYIFGSLDQENSVVPTSETITHKATRQTNIIVGDINLGLGAQFHKTLQNNADVTLGLIYEPKSKISARYDYFFITEGFEGETLIIDTIVDTRDTKSYIEIPDKYTVGFSYKNSQWLVAGDMNYQDWSQVKFFERETPLTKSTSYHLGVQFVPNERALRGYHNWIRYRLGGYYSNTYIKVNEEQIKNFGITFGLGIPLKRSKSIMNFSFSYGESGKNERNLIKEKYFMFNAGLTFQALWFYKPKYE